MHGFMSLAVPHFFSVPAIKVRRRVNCPHPHDLVHPCHSDHAENLHGGLHFFLLQDDVSTSFMLQLFTLINFVLMMFLVRVLIPVPHGWEQAAQELHFPTSHCGGFGQSSATHCLSW
jgi:hypothetical protein